MPAVFEGVACLGDEAGVVAQHQGLDGVAWTRGAHQVFRHKGLGAKGLHELYDRTLPREVNRILKPF